nr:hypothetical protein [Tanacetum cinerariifolium]
MQSPSGSGSLPSNTVANLRGDVKAITTRSGVVYDGPMIPPTHSPLSKEVKRETEATKDKKKLSLPDLTPTRMTLELPTRSIAYPAGIAKDIFMQAGKFTFPVDFVVIDYDVNPRVPFILGRPFLRTARALVDDHFLEVLEFRKSNHPSSGSTTPLSDFSPSRTPFETSDSLLEEFADELALLDTFSLRNEDDNFDFRADLREIEYLLNQDPSTESNIEIINPILEKFSNKPAIDYSPPPRDDDDDDDDLFNLKSDNDESKSFCMLLDNDLTLPEESSEIVTLSSSPFGNKDKVYNPSMHILGRTQIFNDESKDKDLRDKDLILEECGFLSISFDQNSLFIWN